MKAAIYIHVSDDRETYKYRLSLLIEKAKSECSQYKLFSEIADKHCTQPLKKDLLTRINNKEFETIMVYKLSDWSNSMLRLSSELKELDSNGIRFISSYENLDSFSITGKLYLQVLLTMSECEKSFDSGAKENDMSNLNSVDQHFPRHNIISRRASEKRTIGLNYSQGRIPSENTESSDNISKSEIIRRTEKNSDKTDNFDLIGLEEACAITGYSRHTIYQLTSKKLIPHFKRPRGRRIFFSKKDLENWIRTGVI